MRETTCPTCGATVAVPAGVESGQVVCGSCREVIDLDAASQPAPAAEAAPAPAEDAPPAPPQYSVTKFETTTGGNPAGLIVSLGVGVFAALVMAVVFGIIRDFFWLLVVFPALHGLAVGAVIGLAARLVKTRLPVALVSIGFGCAVLSWLGIYFLWYGAFLADPNNPRVSFFGFMDHRATEGVRIGKPGQGGGTNLGYTGTIIYWVVEAVITGIAGAGLAVAPITSPFCDGCNAWKRKRVLGPFLVEPTVAAGAVAAGVPAGFVAPAEGKKKATLSVYACPHCEDEGTIDVSMEGSHTEGKQTMTYKVFMTYPGEALADFERAAEECHQLGLKTK
jgi:hypothetical protein